MVSAYLLQAHRDIKVHHAVWGLEPYTEIDKIISCPAQRLILTSSDKLNGATQSEGLLHLLAHWISWHNNRNWQHKALKFNYIFLACSPTLPGPLDATEAELHRILGLPDRGQVEQYCASKLSGYVNSGSKPFQLQASTPIPLNTVFHLVSVIGIDLRSMQCGAFMRALPAPFCECGELTDPVYAEWAFLCQNRDRYHHPAEFIVAHPTEDPPEIPDHLFDLGL
eukprot:TRINITY_DN17764_c0_g1_i3.p2 TRINITY_DN17764_c0_g1~~TRINITY_DN17764_c0_g1_i3.p2  ORF type:complete len:224 (+),score=33.75 TRINITY_DN17764_c0_g1_i3:1253-1924(+)